MNVLIKTISKHARDNCIRSSQTVNIQVGYNNNTMWTTEKKTEIRKKNPAVIKNRIRTRLQHNYVSKSTRCGI